MFGMAMGGGGGLPFEEEVESQFTIRLVEAKDVQDTQNPFAQVVFEKKVEKTRVQTGLFPGKVAKWNEKFKFLAAPEAIEKGQIKIVLCNQSNKLGSVSIGSVTVELSDFRDGKWHDVWWSAKDDSGQTKGEVHARLQITGPTIKVENDDPGVPASMFSFGGAAELAASTPAPKQMTFNFNKKPAETTSKVDSPEFSSQEVDATTSAAQKLSFIDTPGSTEEQEPAQANTLPPAMSAPPISAKTQGIFSFPPQAGTIAGTRRGSGSGVRAPVGAGAGASVRHPALASVLSGERLPQNSPQKQQQISTAASQVAQAAGVRKMSRLGRSGGGIPMPPGATQQRRQSQQSQDGEDEDAEQRGDADEDGGGGGEGEYRVGPETTSEREEAGPAVDESDDEEDRDGPAT